MMKITPAEMSIMLGVACLVLHLSAATTIHIQDIVNIRLEECSSEGGELILNKCLCKAGYTGAACEVYMFDDVNGDDVIPKTDVRLKTFQEVSAQDGKLRIRRQLENEMSGSGEVPTCSNDQIVADGQCVTVIKFEFRAVLDQTFNEDFNDLNSDASKNFISDFTNQVLTAMTGTGLLTVVVTSLTSGSVKVEGVLNFNQNPPVSSLDVGELMQDNLPSFKSVSVADFDECSSVNSNTCDLLSTTCMNVDSSFQCVCKPGFTGSSATTCTNACDGVDCSNAGSCVYNIADNQTVCRCNGLNYGDRCENSSYSWQQAAIGVGVALAVVLFIILVVAIYFCCRTRTGKSEFTELPMVTGFRPNNDDAPKTYTNPNDVQEGESSHNEEHDIGARTKTTSTFRPEPTDDDM